MLPNIKSFYFLFYDNIQKIRPNKSDKTDKKNEI